MLPVSDYTQRKQIEKRPPADILKLNDWLRAYAAQVNAVYADYYRAVVDDKGFLRDGISGDGLHPDAKGYELMAPVAEAAIRAALRYYPVLVIFLSLPTRAARKRPGHQR